MEAVGRGDRVQFICDWEDSAAAGIAYSGSWIAHDESVQFLGWLWCYLLLLLLRLVIAFTAACFKLISSNQSWDIPSLHMHIYQLAVVLHSVHSIPFILCYMKFKCYHYSFKPIRVPQNGLPSAHSRKQLNGLDWQTDGWIITSSYLEVTLDSFGILVGGHLAAIFSWGHHEQCSLNTLRWTPFYLFR